MAAIKDRLAADLKDAMRARDQVRLRTIRSLRAAIQEKEISERSGGASDLSDEQELGVLQKQAKQRQDAIEQYENAGREDLSSQERDELAVIQSYLPAQLSDDEVRGVLRRIIETTGAAGLSDIGRVMGPAMQQLRGKADGKRVQQMARDELAARAS